MTEAEWLTSDDPRPMLRSLNARWGILKKRGIDVPQTRLRLFACACCRRIWDMLDEDHRTSVNLIEGSARGRTRAGGYRAARRARAASALRIFEELTRAEQSAPEDRDLRLRGWAQRLACNAVWEAASSRTSTSANAHVSVANAVGALELVHATTAEPLGMKWRSLSSSELAAQAQLLRDIVRFPPTEFTDGRMWLSWEGGMILRIAQAVDEETAAPQFALEPARLSVLADALEDAGCTEDAILSHLRSPGQHVRGCWALDIVLGRE